MIALYMLMGAAILAIGFIGGYKAASFMPKKPREPANPYEKYKNPDGLYSRKAVKAARESG